MLSYMNGKMVTASKRTLTVLAVERPIAGVFAVMSSQLVRSCELPLAARPGARVWSVACMNAHVFAQMRQLGV